MTGAFLSAQTSSVLTAPSAGTTPNRTDVTRHTAAAKARTRRSTAKFAFRGISIGGCRTARISTIQLASSKPAVVPATDSSRLSTRSWRTSRSFPAPSASWTAISFWRSAARARSRLARFVQAISNTSPATPISTDANPTTVPRSALPTSPGGERWTRIPSTSGCSRPICAAIVFSSASACPAVMSGFSRPSRFGTSVRTFTVRVSGSTTLRICVTLP